MANALDVTRGRRGGAGLHHSYSQISIFGGAPSKGAVQEAPSQLLNQMPSQMSNQMPSQVQQKGNTASPAPVAPHPAPSVQQQGYSGNGENVYSILANPAQVKPQVPMQQQMQQVQQVPPRAQQQAVVQQSAEQLQQQIQKLQLQQQQIQQIQEQQALIRQLQQESILEPQQQRQQKQPQQQQQQQQQQQHQQQPQQHQQQQSQPHQQPQQQRQQQQQKQPQPQQRQQKQQQQQQQPLQRKQSLHKQPPQKQPPLEDPQDRSNPQDAPLTRTTSLTKSTSRKRENERDARMKAKQKRERRASQASTQLQDEQTRRDREREERIARTRQEELERKEGEKVERRRRAREELERKEAQRRREEDRRKGKLAAARGGRHDTPPTLPPHDVDTPPTPHPDNDPSDHSIERLMDDLRREQSSQQYSPRSKTAGDSYKRIPSRLQPLHPKAKPLTAPALKHDSPPSPEHHPQPPDPVWVDGDQRLTVNKQQIYTCLDPHTAEALWGFLCNAPKELPKEPRHTPVNRMQLEHASGGVLEDGAQVDALWDFLSNNCATEGGVHVCGEAEEPELPGVHEMVTADSSGFAVEAGVPRRKTSIARERLSQLRAEANQQINEEMEHPPSPSPSPIHHAPQPYQQPRIPTPPKSPKYVDSIGSDEESVVCHEPKQMKSDNTAALVDTEAQYRRLVKEYEEGKKDAEDDNASIDPSAEETEENNAVDESCEVVEEDANTDDQDADDEDDDEETEESTGDKNEEEEEDEDEEGEGEDEDNAEEEEDTEYSETFSEGRAEY